MTVMHQFEDGNTLSGTHWGPERVVEISKSSNTALGLSIVGGKVEVVDVHGGISHDINGIFISHVEADSPAGMTGHLKTGDHILEVNGINIRESTYEHAINVIKSSENTVRFRIQSFRFSNTTSNANGEIKSRDSENAYISNGTGGHNIKRSFSNAHDANESSSSGVVTKSKSSQDYDSSDKPSQNNIPRQVSDDSSDSEDERYLEGNILTKAGVEISRRSAGNVKRSTAEIEADPETEDEFGYTMQKIKKKYNQLGAGVLLIELPKDGRDIGIALAGHKDRLKMGIFVCGINPKGSAMKTGKIKVGDEILEVNGHVFRGRCHLNACSTIKKMPTMSLKVIVHRRASHDNLAVKPITHFPVPIDEKDRYSQYDDVRTIPIQKGEYGLGIMIVEGKHARVGKGIFVSDLQEGSLAEKAGLQVGDMILGVNSDTLVGATKEEATNLLKEAEGLVILTVCNPNKSTKDQAGSDSNKKGDSGAAAQKSGTSATKGDDVKKPAEPPKEKAPESKPVTAELQISNDNGIKFSIVGGSDTPCIGVFVIDAYADNIGSTTMPLKSGDQILEFGQENFKSIEALTAQEVLLSTSGLTKMTYLRDETAIEEVEVELQNRPGKGIGLCLTEFKSGKGVYISELIAGGAGIESEKLAIGDHIVSISGQDVRESSGDDIATLMKVSPTVTLKIVRYKGKQTTK